MSDDHEHAGDMDLLAGEYVLGCLDAREMRSVEVRAAADPVLQRSIQIWMARLAPLTLSVLPVVPPAALWARLAAAIGDTTPVAAAPDPAVPPSPMLFPTGPSVVTGAPDIVPPDVMPPNVMPLRAPRPPQSRAAVWRSVGFWRASTAFATALAAGLAAFIVVHQPEPAAPGGYMAALTAPSGPAPGFMAHSEPDGSIMVAALGTPPPSVPNRDMELWALPAGATKPVSLGVMPASGMKVTMHDMPRDQTELMISLEPAGGSPSGAPTGPVLYQGKLASL